jgi:hypothetical protein
VPSPVSNLQNGNESSHSLPAAVISERNSVLPQAAPAAAIMTAATVPVVSIAAGGVAADQNWLDDNFDD